MLKTIGLKAFFGLFVLASSASAQLDYPVDVAVDRSGTIVVADLEGHSLLKWTGTGFVVLAKGEGLPRTPLFGIRHVAARGDGSFVVSDPATMKLYSIDASGAIEPVPDDDRFVTPWGLAIEPSGSILAVDRVTHRLRRVAKDGSAEDVSEIRAPRAVLFDKEGVPVVLTDDNLVRVVGGAPTPLTNAAPFEFPHDAVLHPDGNFYVTDGYAKAIWKVTAAGEVTPFVTGAPLISPQGIAVDAKGNLLVADAHAQAIFSINPKGELTQLGQ